jgi:aspartyl protease family protein
MPAAMVHAEESSTVGYRLPEYTAGVQAYRSGDYEKAVNYFRRALAQDADNTNAHYYLGLSLDNLNMANNAAAEYQYVLLHGQEAKIVDYARTRLSLLRPQLTASTASNQSIAMVAAGGPTATSVYRGSAAQFAVPLRNSRNALMVDATLSGSQNKATGVFIIDTGATYTSISQEMAEQLGLDLENCEKVHITTANGRIEVPKVVIETLNVNGLEAHNVEATVIQVRHGSSFSGLLGLSFIRQFVLTIDPQGGQLIFQRN